MEVAARLRRGGRKTPRPLFESYFFRSVHLMTSVGVGSDRQSRLSAFPPGSLAGASIRNLGAAAGAGTAAGAGAGAAPGAPTTWKASLVSSTCDPSLTETFTVYAPFN